MYKILLVTVSIIAITLSSCKKNEINDDPSVLGQVVYMDYKNDSTTQIILQNVDGTGRTVLVQSGLNYLTSKVYYRKFVYVTTRNNMESIYLYDLNNNSTTKVYEDNTTKYISLSQLSPTADKVIFNLSGKMCTINIDGTNFKTYNDYDIRELQPIITTDGQNIIFAVNIDDDCLSNQRYLYNLNMQTNSVILLDSFVPFLLDNQVRLSEKNNKLLYDKNTIRCSLGTVNYNKWSLGVVNLNGGNQDDLFTWDDFDAGNYFVESTWNNNGNKIAAINNEELIMMNADGNNKTILTSLSDNRIQFLMYIGEALPIDWSADDKNILTVETDETKYYICIINTETKVRTDIFSRNIDDVNFDDFMVRVAYVK